MLQTIRRDWKSHISLLSFVMGAAVLLVLTPIWALEVEPLTVKGREQPVEVYLLKGLK